MKRLVSICSCLTLVVTCLACGGCFRKDRAPTEEPPDRATGSQAEPEFIALDLPEDREVVPAEYPITGAIQLTGGTEPGAAASSGSSMDSALIGPEAADTFALQTYRVQLFTSQVYGEAHWAKKVADEIFDRPVHLDYEIPYYKVRVGGFSTRDAAEEYQQRVRAAGYPEAWVVVVNVDVREAPALYLDGVMVDTVMRDAPLETEGDGTDD